MNENRTSKLTQDLIEAGRRLDRIGLAPARDGNLSARLDEGRVLITATGVRKRDLSPDDLVTVDLEGKVLSGGRPSGEVGLHLFLYRLRPDVQAVIHAHPPVAGGFASAHRGLTEPLMPEAVVHLGPVPLTPYATPGTPELDEAVRDAARDHQGFLLANHGAVTLGASVDEALDRMEILEHLARISLVASLLGGTNPLDQDQLAPLLKLLGRL